MAACVSWGMRLRARLTLSLLLPLILVLGVHGVLRVRQERGRLLNAHQQSLARSADVIAAALENELGQPAPRLTALLAPLARTQQQIARVRLFGPDGAAIVVSSLAAVTAQVPEARTLAVIQRGVAESFHVENGQLALFNIRPLRDRDGNVVAALEVVELASAVQVQVADAIRDVWLRLGLVTLVLAVVSGLVLRRQVFARLSRLEHGIASIAAGRASARVDVDRRDELGRLAEAFNDMAAQLESARIELETETGRALELQDHLRHADRLAIAGRLASGLAHEIGTPLNIISGRAEMLLESLPPDDRRRSELAAIVEQIDRIASFVRSLLESTRRGTRQMQPVSLQDVVRRLWPLVEHEARRRDVAVAADVPSGLPSIVADPGQLQQVIVNLLMNAIEACPRGARAALIVAPQARDGRPGIVLDVQDTGPGIAPQHREKIFEPFFSSKPPGQGTGLGLTISRDIVRAHGGDIRVADTGARGTTVTVWLPLANGGRDGG